MSEPYDHRAPATPPSGHGQGWPGTSRMPMQALGAAPSDLPPAHQYPPYGQPEPRQQQRTGKPSARRPPTGGATRSKAMDYTLKGLGLLAVAVVSGFAWYLIRNNPAPPSSLAGPPTQDSAGKYNFALFNGPDQQADCAAHSRGNVASFLTQHQCVSLTRNIYTTSLQTGDRVVTSVEVVQMRTGKDARDLNAPSERAGSGHVQDQVEEGSTVVVGGPKSLENGGYSSETRGAKVIIAVTEYQDVAKDSDANLASSKPVLQAVSQDALRLGAAG